jgi:hypothetical protein
MYVLGPQAQFRQELLSLCVDMYSTLVAGLEFITIALSTSGAVDASWATAVSVKGCKPHIVSHLQHGLNPLTGLYVFRI